jgi:Zn-dependent protease with chaperone function
MALRDRKFWCGNVMLTAALFLLLATSAWAAIQRPNTLDRRVDTLMQSELMTQPATTLVDPTRQAAALRRAHWTLLGWIATVLFEAAALFYLWSSGSAAALRDWLRRRIRSEGQVRFLFGAALALVARAAALVPSFYLFRVDRVLQLTTDLTRVWALFWIFHTLLGMIVAGLIAAVVLWLAERTHQWYVYTIAAILAASVGWSYASAYVQSPAGALRPLRGAPAVALQELLGRAGLANVPIMESGNGAWVGGAAVLAVGPFRRVVLRQSLVAAETTAEIEYRVAYQLARVLHGDLLAIGLIEGGVIIIFATIAIVIADRVRFRRDDDPLSRLAIVGALLALVYLAAVPVRNAALRSYVFDADRYAVALTGNPSAAVRALVRTADQRMEEVCPESAAALFLYTAPGIGARVAEINRVPSGCSR